MNKANTMMKIATTITLSASIAMAQDLTITAPPQVNPIAIVGATVHTVSGPVYEDGWVLFEDGFITGVGPAGSDRIFNATTTIIDATGKHVYPGLIGSYTQLGMREIGSVRATRDEDELGALSPEARSTVAVNPDSWLLPVARHNGVLAAGVFPTGGSIPGRAGVIQLEGWTTEDLTLEANAGLVINWPRQRPIDAWWMDQSDAEQLDEIREQMRVINDIVEQAEAYRDAGDNATTDLVLEAIVPSLPRGREEPEKQVFIQANDLDQITSAVSWATGKGMRVVLLGARDAPLAADLLKEHDVSVIALGNIGFPKRADSPYDDAYTLPARLEAAGISWCLQSGDEPAHERNLPHYAGQAVAYGLDPEAALRGITLSAAEILGVDRLIGSLEAGKHATLLVADGNIFEVTTTVERAFVQGRDIDLSNKQTELADKYREKYRQLNVNRANAPQR
ncbi:MAG: amidohydrolase family protein [Planctomycetota bacterium]